MQTIKDIKRDNIQIFEALKSENLNPHLHYLFGLSHFVLGNIFIANAELRSARTLGYDPAEVEKQLNNLYGQLGLAYDLKSLDVQAEHHSFFRNNLEHNQFYRAYSLSQCISKVCTTYKQSVLDIGGGDGKLAFLLPNCDYCLAEPLVNGISGTELPFEESSFDVVVACHVLEHIPEDQRHIFLDQLCDKAKSDVFLLNPFQNNKIPHTDILELIIDLTDATWAKEHLQCGLPKIEIVENYAKERGIFCEIRPNGTFLTTIAVELLQYYAMRAGCSKDCSKINKFLNNNLTHILDNEHFPTAKLIHFKLNK